MLILSAWLTFLASYYNRLSSYHLHMITILVSSASVSLTYFVYKFVNKNVTPTLVFADMLFMHTLIGWQ